MARPYSEGQNQSFLKNVSESDYCVFVVKLEVELCMINFDMIASVFGPKMPTITCCPIRHSQVWG